MPKRIRMTGFSLIAIAISLCIGSTGYALDTNLVGLLTKSLGVTDKQAEGGAGAIFTSASKNMSVEDFAQVTDALPEVQSLMNAVPSSDTGSSTLGSLSSTFSKAGGSISSLAGLVNTFSQLGLSADMVQKYIPIVLDYSQSKGGDTVASLLKNALL